jgi:5-methylcytosine-specific restriction endonuclease McrA
MAHYRGRFYRQARWINRVRKQVLLNANYQCARCHADLHNTGKHAHVHHIIPLTHAPELGFDLFNLEALCTHCHNKEHGRGVYGCAVDGTPLDPSHPWNSTGGNLEKYKLPAQ